MSPRAKMRIELLLAGILGGMLIFYLWYTAPGRVLPECARGNQEVPRYCVE